MVPNLTGRMAGTARPIRRTTASCLRRALNVGEGLSSQSATIATAPPPITGRSRTPAPDERERARTGCLTIAYTYKDMP
jgi:hypothetical protein